MKVKEYTIIRLKKHCWFSFTVQLSIDLSRSWVSFSVPVLKIRPQLSYLYERQLYRFDVWTKPFEFYSLLLTSSFTTSLHSSSLQRQTIFRFPSVGPPSLGFFYFLFFFWLWQFEEKKKRISKSTRVIPFIKFLY